MHEARGIRTLWIVTRMLSSSPARRMPMPRLTDLFGFRIQSTCLGVLYQELLVVVVVVV